MSRQLSELEACLAELIAEHQRLFGLFATQQAAMKAFDMKSMDAAANAQEASRLRIAALDTKRRGLTLQLARAQGIQGNPKIAELARLYPQRTASSAIFG